MSVITSYLLKIPFFLTAVVLGLVLIGKFKRRKKMNPYGSNKILVVESDKENRSRLCEFLENLGCRVIEADNSRDAIRFGLSEIPDLILMDLDLPENDGLETISIIWQLSSLRKVPILACSANGSRGIELLLNTNIFGEGDFEYITKPISLNDIEFYLNLMLPKIKKAA